ncbi:MAG: BON domain-containing protein [Bacteroidota bacterium]
MPATPQVLGHRLPSSLRRLFDAVQTRQAETTTDRSIVRRIKSELKRAEGPNTGLSFYVHSGAVSIYGTVGSPDVRDAVLTLVTSQPGVRRVVDHLELAGTQA